MALTHPAIIALGTPSILARGLFSISTSSQYAVLKSAAKAIRRAIRSSRIVMTSLDFFLNKIRQYNIKIESYEASFF
jgi:hypothetical protein